MKILLLISIITILLFGCASQPSNSRALFTSITPLAATQSFVTAEQVKPKTNSAVVISQHANLHESANQKSGVLDVVPQDASVEVIKQRGVWFLVKTETAQGWMHGNTLRLEKFDTTSRITKQPKIQTAEPETNNSGATAKCRDGSLSYSAHRRGTCSHHGGVAEWY